MRISPEASTVLLPFAAFGVISLMALLMERCSGDDVSEMQHIELLDDCEAELRHQQVLLQECACGEV